MHRHVLITGLSATGKSYLCEYFRRRKKNAYDTDEAISRWVDKKTHKPKEPSSAEWKKVSGIEWEWDIRMLKKLLRLHKEAYLFGMSDNMWKHLDLFDDVYYLHANRRLISQRLRNKSRQNDFGRHPHQRRLIMSWIGPVAERAKKAKLEFIDASMTPRQIFELVVKNKPAKLTRPRA